MKIYKLYNALCKELNFDEMIDLYKLIKHKIEFLGDEPINYCECEKDNSLEDMTNFIEKVYKEAKKEPSLEEELEKEREFLDKIKGD